MLPLLFLLCILLFVAQSKGISTGDNTLLYILIIMTIPSLFGRFASEEDPHKPDPVDAETMTTILRRCPEGIMVIRGQKKQQTYHYAVGGLAFELSSKGDFSLRDGIRVVDLRKG